MGWFSHLADCFYPVVSSFRNNRDQLLLTVDEFKRLHRIQHEVLQFRSCQQVDHTSNVFLQTYHLRFTKQSSDLHCLESKLLVCRKSWRQNPPIENYSHGIFHSIPLDEMCMIYVLCSTPVQICIIHSCKSLTLRCHWHSYGKSPSSHMKKYHRMQWAINSYLCANSQKKLTNFVESLDLKTGTKPTIFAFWIIIASPMKIAIWLANCLKYHFPPTPGDCHDSFPMIKRENGPWVSGLFSDKPLGIWLLSTPKIFRYLGVN